MFRYLFIVFGLMISVVGNAQQITEGVFEYGFISYKIISDSADMDVINSVVEQLERTPDATIYFTPNRLSLASQDINDQNIRGVIDLDNHQEYNFTDISGVKAFIIIESEPDYSKPIPINKEYGEGKSLGEKIFDLNCIEYTTTNDGSSVSLLTTNDITFPDSTMLNSMQTDVGFLLRSTVTDSTIGISYSIGVKSFSPVIVDRSVISIDTTGMNNMTGIRDEFMKAVREKKE